MLLFLDYYSAYQTWINNKKCLSTYIGKVPMRTTKSYYFSSRFPDKNYFFLNYFTFSFSKNKIKLCMYFRHHKDYYLLCIEQNGLLLKLLHHIFPIKSIWIFISRVRYIFEYNYEYIKKLLCYAYFYYISILSM